MNKPVLRPYIKEWQTYFRYELNYLFETDNWNLSSLQTEQSLNSYANKLSEL